MLKRLLVAVCTVVAVSTILPAAAQAQDSCWALGGFGNVFRLRFTAAAGTPARFIVTGAENVFGDRAVTGAAYLGVNSASTLRIGFTDHAVTETGTDIHFNVSISTISPFPGTYVGWRDAFGDRISGAFTLVTCTGVPISKGADVAAGN